MTNSGRSVSVSVSRSKSVTDVTHDGCRCTVSRSSVRRSPELDKHWRALGLRRLSLLDSQLCGARACCGSSTTAATRWSRSATCSAPRDRSLRVIDAAAAVGAASIYMLTGGRGAAHLGAGRRAFLRRDRALCPQRRAGGRRTGHRDSFEPLRRHPHRPHAARHHHARRDGGSGHLHRPVPLLGRSRFRRAGGPGTATHAAGPVERLRARRPSASRSRGARRRRDPDRALRRAGAGRRLRTRLRPRTDRSAHRRRGPVRRRTPRVSMWFRGMLNRIGRNGIRWRSETDPTMPRCGRPGRTSATS